MQRVSQVLQFPVIIECSGPSLLESQLLQELDLFPGSFAIEGRILEEFFEPWLFFKGWLRLFFNKLEPLGLSRGNSPVQDDLHTESRQVHGPGLNETTQEGNAVIN